MRRWLICVAVGLLFLAVAFRCGWLATHDLLWPYDYDLYRDAAIAHILMHGRYPADAYYAGAWNWYNPLVPAIVALAARCSGLEPTDIYARHGAVLALAIPCAVFALAVRLFGRYSALAALFAFLFLAPTEVPPWAGPSYSPWLFTNVVSLVPFALTLLLVLQTAARAGAAGPVPHPKQSRWWAACGLMLGLTFLAHTSSAIIAGLITLVLAWEPNNLANVARRCALVLGAGFIASLPLTVSILGRYHLHIRNPAPLNFLSDETQLAHLHELLRGALNLKNLFALAGFVLLFRKRTPVAVRNAMLTWLAICLLMLLHGFVRQAWPSAGLHGLIPPFHWLFHLRLAGSLLLGCGLFWLVESIASRLPARWKLPAPAALAAVLCVLLLINYRTFARRYDFTVAREFAMQYATMSGFTETVQWLRRETPPDAVVLADKTDALILLGAAGRRSVVVDESFSNPYLSFRPRESDANTMVASIANNDPEQFFERARKYRVSYVLLGDAAGKVSARYAQATFVREVFLGGDYAVLQVVGP